MRSIRSAVSLAAAALVGGSALGGSTSAVATLTPNESGPFPAARGKLDVKHISGKGGREDREWFRLRANKLGKKADYTLHCDDPATTEDASLVEFATVTTRGKGNINFRLDTRKDDLPHGATAADLGGLVFELRDMDGVVVLAGPIPSLPADDSGGEGETE
jgi:hypothetical protein